MQTLNQDTQASWIQGTTQQVLMYVVLPEGTEYQTISLWYDQLGFCWKRINVAGMEYDIIG